MHALLLVVPIAIIMNDGGVKHPTGIITAMMRGIMRTVPVAEELLTAHKAVGEILLMRILDRVPNRAVIGVKVLKEIRREGPKVEIIKDPVLIRIPLLLAVAHLTVQALSR